MLKPNAGDHTSVRPRTLTSLGLAALVLARAALAQEPPPPQKPSPEHQVLAADQGTWDATIKTYLRGPDAEPAVSTGTEVNEVLPGGFWVLSKFEADFGGTKLLGRGQYGYDPVKRL